MQKSDLDELVENIAIDDYDRCHLLLQRIWVRRPSFDECCGLLDQLNDGYDDTGTMFGIIHAIERAVPSVMYDAIASKLLGLLKRSPEWTRLLIARNLAAVDGQASGHSAYDFLNTVTNKSHPSCFDVVRQVYDEQMKKGEIRKALRHPMLN